MKKPETQIRPDDKRPITKATMDKPQEEFIGPEGNKQPPAKEASTFRDAPRKLEPR
jgi:hypothetical protein